MSRLSPRFVACAIVMVSAAAALALAAAGPRSHSGPLFTTFPCPSNPALTCVMSGLDNPRGLAFFPSDDTGGEDHRGERDGDTGDGRGHDGTDGSTSDIALYVAEAGRGGLGLATSDCFTGQAGGTRCYGPNGAITRLWKGIQQRVVSGLPSHANLLGRQAIGPHDIALVAGRHDRRSARRRDCDPACAYVTIGLQQPPRFREDFPFLKDFAKLLRVSATGHWDYIADLGSYEVRRDPDRAFYEPDKLDTNPYSLLAGQDGGDLVVTDAGGNSLLLVGTNGHISTRAVFPPHPDDSVPTSAVVGPDGAYYVGELTGFPAVPGAANLYRAGGSWKAPEVCLTGFTQIIDIAFDTRDNLYVLEYSGTLIRVVPDGSAVRDRDHDPDLCAQYLAGERTPVLSGLTNPTSVAVGPDGGLYISNLGIFPATGEVVRFVPPPPAGACSHDDCDDGNLCTHS